jgi:hypothetical protein
MKRTLILIIAALALFPAAAMAGEDHSGDYGHHTVGSDNNDDSGNVEHDEHPRDDYDNNSGRKDRRVADDGRPPINKDHGDGHGHQGDFGND